MLFAAAHRCELGVKELGELPEIIAATVSTFNFQPSALESRAAQGQPPVGGVVCFIAAYFSAEC